jgi:LysM repeat protein
MSTVAIHPGHTRLRRPAPAPAAAAVRAGATPARLTRRGRVVAVLLLLALALAVLTVYGSHSAATGEAGTPVPTRTVEVGAGDTLWEIASQTAEPGHVREMVRQIQELNALPSAGLRVGQEIAVPVR